MIMKLASLVIGLEVFCMIQLQAQIANQDSNVSDNIAFTVEVTNSYVNTGQLSAQIHLQQGIPSFIAATMDDTNYQNDAMWQDYTGTNIVIDIGSNEGWHEIWIGLKGFAPDSPATWQWKRLKLDTTPPQIVITNPVITTVDKPIIQLQGYSPEALGSLTCDLSNAVNVITNQLVEIVGEAYNTNTWEFTTNYFQAYDMPLTSGLNQITIHARDMAGNTTVTNFSFTLDYSSKTNPPTVQLLWPLDGMEIVGNDIVCRGYVNDDTATVTVQLVDAKGATNSVGSLVGRDGIFYAGNLTLADGTNYLSYTATDAAGNVTTTNITVSTSDVGLTLDPVVAGQTLVTGTISDSSYMVYVNGVKATNNGIGRWSAIIKPIGVGGGSVVVNAIKN
jgi:hypothetical protein